MGPHSSTCFLFHFLNGLWIEWGGGPPHFFCIDDFCMKKSMNQKNLRHMWLKFPPATFGTKIEFRGQGEHIKHFPISGEVRPPHSILNILVENVLSNTRTVRIFHSPNETETKKCTDDYAIVMTMSRPSSLTLLFIDKEKRRRDVPQHEMTWHVCSK